MGEKGLAKICENNETELGEVRLDYNYKAVYVRAVENMLPWFTLQFNSVYEQITAEKFANVAAIPIKTVTEHSVASR